MAEFPKAQFPFRSPGPPTVQKKDLLARAAERRMLLAIDAAWHYEWSKTSLVVSTIFYFHPYFGKWSDLTSIFQMGWNHQPV